MTLGGVLAETTRRLETARVADARLLAELLAAHALGCARLELYGRYGQELDDRILGGLAAGAECLARKEPIQYVLGEVCFMDCTLSADRRALIPRPETELLVEHVLSCEAVWERPRPRIADVGTGGGCIVILLARSRPEAVFAGVDISRPALALARENARLAGVENRIQWREGDLLEGFEDHSLDLVVANLPYVASDALATLPETVRGFEPLSALDGGPDGLRCISRLVEQAPGALKSGGWLFMEIGEAQAGQVQGMLADAGFARIGVDRDLSKRDRYVQGMKP